MKKKKIKGKEIKEKVEEEKEISEIYKNLTICILILENDNLIKLNHWYFELTD
jgi:hypothetical protein